MHVITAEHRAKMNEGSRKRWEKYYKEHPKKPEIIKPVFIPELDIKWDKSKEPIA